MTIRPAVVADAPQLAAVHFHAWQEAYRGLVPPEIISPLDDQRIGRWQRALETPRPRTTLVVAERQGQVIGFAGTQRSPNGLELQTMYVHPDHWSTGAGRALMLHVFADWARAGIDRAHLWVLVTNDRARRFYEGFGWRSSGEENVVAVGGTELPVIRYDIDIATAR